MSRLDETFARLRAEHRTGLVAYVTAGDPDLARSAEVIRAVDRGGADVIELGVPFSDPMADGPTIQRASERALAGGMSLRKVVELVVAFRATDRNTPVVLMGYANPIEAMGLERFAAAAAQAGVDGVLVVDYPPEEAAAFGATIKAQGMDPIFLLAPTSTVARIEPVSYTHLTLPTNREV